MNSNTSGSAVANVGFFPSSLLPVVAAQVVALGNALTKAAAADDSLLASVDFASQAGTDKIVDAVMEEIARRLVVTLETQEQGNVVYSPTEPEDLTKAWIKTDPVTGLPINGIVYVYDSNTETWVPSPNQGAYVPPEKRFSKQTVAAGASTINFPFADMGTANYFPTLTFTTQAADGSWNAPPVSYPAGFGYLVTNQTNTTCSVSFWGVPVGGMSAILEVEEIPET